MIIWIKRIANCLAVLAFFGVFLYTVDPLHILDVEMLGLSALNGALAAALFWFTGFIIADIALKGIIEDVHGNNENGEILEGGLVQRLEDEKGKVEYDAAQRQIGDPRMEKQKVQSFLKKVKR
jgi:hypothetical protein